MLTTAEWLFWGSLLLIFYSYLGYGILLYFLVWIRIRLSKKPWVDQSSSFEPAVSLVVAAYNEEAFIREKIENSLGLDYPAGKLEIYFVTDGSTDQTAAIVEEYPRITHLHEAGRKGKAVAINRVMRQVTSPVTVFCDANTLLNRECIREIVKYYIDPGTGGVAGEKKIGATGIETAAGAGEGFYWKYESALKKLDSGLYTVVGAAGELFSIRTELFEDLDPNSLLDDFVLSLKICRKGFRIQYEPRAYALEAPSASIGEERKRKIRISAGAFQSMWMLRDLLNPFTHPLLSFQYVSHRVLRWAICPLCLLILLVCNGLLAWREGSRIYLACLAGQAFFYGLALAGWALSSRKTQWKILFIPYYFLFMNVSVFIGFYRFLLGRQSVLWEKAGRSGE
jgi:biofilm PGA synthesis N-glycosyltransferase PgaC